MNTSELKKGFSRLAWTLGSSFVGPTVIYQAFKNQNHPWFWPVFGVGCMIALLAIVTGFLGIRSLVNGLLGSKKMETPPEEL